MNKRIAFLGTGLAAGILCTAMAVNAFAAQVTEEQAKTIAMEDAGISQSDIAFEKLELDYEDGRMVYDVEFYTTDYKEYNYEIDRETGTIVSKDYDAEHFYRGWEKNGYQAKTAASPNQGGQRKAQAPSQEGIDRAKAAALAAAGLEDSQVTWGRVKMDYDDGRAVYEGKFFCDSLEYEFEVDAAEGIVTEWDVESIYD